MILLIYLMVFILLRTFKITSNLSSKTETLTENLSAQIYPNKIKNKIIFKIKTGYKLELFTPETMRLLGSTNKGVNKDKDSEKVPKLASVEIVLVHCNLVKNDYQHQTLYLLLFQTKNLDSYQILHHIL